MDSAHPSLSHAQLLDRLADVAVETGVNIQQGQDLLISADISMLPLVRRITDRAYRRGAELVTVLYDDEEAVLARFRFAPETSFDRDRDWLHQGIARAIEDGRTARIRVVGEDPNLLEGLDHGKVARAEKAFSIARKPVIEKITRFETNWSIVPYATQAWARAVFGERDDAVDLLWNALFAATRVDASVADPTAAWAEHNAELSARRRMLDRKQYRALHFTGPGTDLRVGLADGHAWGGGAGKTLRGVICNPNIPTEEVFTTPHRLHVDGHVTSTKPLAHQGVLIKDISVRFEEGRIVEARCGAGEGVFHKLLEADEGARRLGEVALVPHSSPISATGILFLETLLDENAASHIALGQAYSKCLKNADGASEQELADRGANHSMIHVDWMIGSGQTDVDGITASGQNEPLMRSGEWVTAAPR